MTRHSKSIRTCAGERREPPIIPSTPVFFSFALKDAPYVNIFNFINACRTGQEPKTFTDRSTFRDYTTMPGMRIDLAYAKKNELLAPLLQDLTKGRNAHDPVAQRQRLLDETNRRLRER